MTSEVNAHCRCKGMYCYCVQNFRYYLLQLYRCDGNSVFFGPFFAYMLWMTENYLRQSCRTGKILCSFYYIETIETMWAEIIFRFSFQYSFDTHSKQIKLHPLCRYERGFVISVNENERKHLDQWNFCTHIYVHHIYS